MKRPKPRGTSAHLAHLHAAFLSILPRVERRGRIYFRPSRPIMPSFPFPVPVN
jgi:hypothetical protein